MSSCQKFQISFQNLSYVTSFQGLILLRLFFCVFCVFFSAAPWTPNRVDMCALQVFIFISIIITLNNNILIFLKLSPEDDQSILIQTSSWNQRFFSEPPQLIRE